MIDWRLSFLQDIYFSFGDYALRLPYLMQIHSYRMDDFMADPNLQEQSERISSILDPEYIDQERVDE